MRTVVLTLLALMGVVLIAGFILTSASVVTIDGQVIRGPLGIAIGGWGIVFSTVIVFCAAILLTFFFSGLALFILGILTFVGLVVGVALMPILFPLLIPLFIIWVFVAALRKSGKVQDQQDKGQLRDTHVPHDAP